MKSHYEGFAGGAPMLDLAFLIARLVIGLLVAAHGARHC
jgi:hypothetical protein